MTPRSVISPYPAIRANYLLRNVARCPVCCAAQVKPLFSPTSSCSTDLCSAPHLCCRHDRSMGPLAAQADDDATKVTRSSCGCECLGIFNCCEPPADKYWLNAMLFICIVYVWFIGIVGVFLHLLLQSRIKGVQKNRMEFHK